ncbi:unnamed protein product [Amoebophrya sp. A25]|nr:unnamed protein product [Amoebophrya sp. A25]|eukprot:GSA25T00025317001.1
MPQPYSWLKLQNAGSVSVSPRAGHTITSTNFGFVLYGGMDGRRNDQGNPSPNSDLYLLKLPSKGMYEWQMIELDPASGIPPARTLHSATCNGEEVVVFGGIHSATPYQCLNDGWVLDTEQMEWKRIQFKASLTGQKGSYSRRMTGLIQDRPAPASVQAAILGRRGSASKLMMGKSSKLGFTDLAGGAALASRQSKMQPSAGSASGSKIKRGGGGSKSWKDMLKAKMNAGAGGGAPSRSQNEAGGGGAAGFHSDLVNVVSQGFSNMVDTSDQPSNVPTQRANHTLSLIQESSVALFGGHGGSGYTRKAFNDTWVLNLDNNRWTQLVCQGNPPAPRSGHSAFAKDGCLFIFGGWNNDGQFNDFFMLDVENKDWTDMDLNWSVPRWNHCMQLVEAIPSWRVFIFGGSADSLGTGRSLGVVDDKLGCLLLADKFEWSTPTLENKANDARIPPREHTAICYDKEESRLIFFGGWANKWLDDCWQINVSSIVGPPYAVIGIKPHLGPVSGGQKVQISGIGFRSTQGQVVVRFITPKFYAESQGTVIDDELIECNTPDVVQTIGPKDCEVRLAIGIRDFTTTMVKYKYFLNTIAEKSLCYGPGLQEDQQAGAPDRFTIQAINELGENRTSGADEFRITLQKKIPIIEEGAAEDAPVKYRFEDAPFEFIDHDTGKYEVVYTPDEAEYKIEVFLKGDNEKEYKIRGTPFMASAVSAAKNRANDYTGPLMVNFVSSTMKALDEYAKSTDAGIHAKIKDGDVRGLIKIKNHIQETEDKREYLQRKQDEIFASLKHMEKEGIPSDKQFKLLKKIGDSINVLHESCAVVAKEIAPMVQRESDIYQKKIHEFEEELKNYVGGLRKEAYYYYKSGLELAYERCDGVDKEHANFTATLDFLFHIASNFDYPGMVNASKKLLAAIKEDSTCMRSLWVFEQMRIEKTEEFLNARFFEIKPMDMEDEIKALGKKLREVKVDRKCEAFLGIQEILKKWTVFCPLVAELRDPAMRQRHWIQLMGLTGKSVTIDKNILLRDMWNMELHKTPDAVEETADQAKQEAKMEVTLGKLNAAWSVVEFGFETHKQTDIMLMKVKDEDFEMLEENQVAVQNMFASRYLATFETEITTWQKTLANIAEVSNVMSEVQRSWAFLENLFIHSEEVKKELPDESERFVGIDADVKELLAKGFNVKLAKEFCNEPGMYGKLEKAQTQLTMCEKALNEFMNGKRRAFPRFYFMSSADLLDVLSNGNNPAKVVPQFPKFFIAINSYKLEYPDGENKRPHAVGMDACVGVEYVPFPEPCPLVGKVEIYLDKCIEAFRYCLAYYTKHDMQKYIDMECHLGGDRRGKWLCDPEIGVGAAQVALLVDLITWVMLVEGGFDAVAAGNSNGVSNAADVQANLVVDLIKMTMGELTKPMRTKVMCMITLDAHNRDVQTRLVNDGVTEPTAFQWQSMLKCYWVEEVDDARLKIADAVFPYGYEYLGNGPRLVVTPLTDRIYVTATQALHLCMGCAPAGPAGTGKTESTKDLANALAKACYVINAAPEMDYLTMGNIFKGLAASGSWGCFDEFNRLVPEVLSVCTVQFKAVCDAVKARSRRFILQGDEINLDPQVGAFITMNPGYLGRSELPEGLKALFRPITVMVPDFRLIMENMCMAEGFTEAGALGLKFSTLYALAADLLSKSNKYDWGMRAIKSVLVVAGGFKRADPSLPEQAVLMRSLRDTNEAKIEGDDLIIFMGLLADLFPGINVPRARDYDFEAIIVTALQEDFGYTHDSEGYLLLKITQMVELLGIRHCIFLMGNPGSYKSALWKILSKAKTRVGDKTTVVDFSPKAISTNELYGYVNMSTREWKDGIFSKTMRDLGQIPDTHPKWIILDGDLDANWIESMNSVMDDNRLLTLPSNERIPLKLNMKLIFEIRDLNYATPATATRAGIVCMADVDGVQWRSYVNSWINRLDPIWTPAAKDQLRKYWEKYLPESLLFIKKQAKVQVPMYDIAPVMVICSLLDSLIKKPDQFDSLEYWFVFCAVFAIGGCLAEVDGIDYRKMFSTWWKNEMKTIKYPSKGTVFDFFIMDARLQEWSAILETIDYDSKTPMGQVTVPTTETIALSYVMRALIEVKAPVMLIGAAGCGKTQACNGLLKSLDPELFCSHNINMNFYTDSTLLQAMMESPLEKKAGRLYAPTGKLHMIYFVDDLNMPALDPYNTQTSIELMRQKQDYNHWFDRAKITLKDIGNTSYLCGMNPTAGSFIINQRLQRHFWTAAVPFPEQSALTTIYTTFMKGHYEKLPFKASVTEVVTSIIKGALSLHSQVSSTFRKTAANFHYEFNVRHLSGVFDGMLAGKPKEFTDAEKLVLLWLHESERVYGDRLVNPQDLKKYRALAAELSKKMFNKYNFTKYFQEKNPEMLVFVPFSQGLERMEEGIIYDKLNGVAACQTLLNGALDQYNENNAAMDLVLFEDAMKHVAKITRIITKPSGHPLLVGVGGSGRQSLSRLSAYVCLCTTIMIVISGAYGMNDLKTDLQVMYQKAGVKDEGVMFLFTDGQITNEKFLVYINDLLSSGEIADLYAAEDKDVIRNAVRSGCKAEGIPDTPDNLWTFFISRIKKNLHMSLCFSPVGEAMRNRARKFPGLVNCTVIDWFQPWPADALYDVGQKFLAPIEELGPEDGTTRAGIVQFFPESFALAGSFSQKYIDVERRFAYSTPKSFLEFIKLYSAKVGGAVSALFDKKERLENGLTKLKETQVSVAALEEDLKAKAVFVKEKADAADKFAQEVGIEKANVNEETEKANIEAGKCDKIAKEVAIQAASCEKDLAAAAPLVAQAEAALDVLNKKDFQELKALGKPPGGVDVVCECAMHLQAGISADIEIDKKGKVKDTSWKGAQKMMNNPEKFLESLKAFKPAIDDGLVPASNIEAAKKAAASIGDDFTPDVMRKKSLAAAGLCEWIVNIIMYYEVVVTVEPKKQALREANATLAEAADKLAAVNALVADLQAKLAKLMKDFDAAMADKAAVMAEAKKCQDKLDMAQRLINALSANGVIWEQTVLTVDEDLVVMPGEVLISCAFASYLGVFTREYRESCTKAFMDFLRLKNVPISNGCDPLKLLANDAVIAGWASQGLPSDRVSSENGAIMTNSQRWCLIIDPQMQGILWIKNKEASNNLQVTRMGHPKMVNTFEVSLDTGKSVIIENMGEGVDAVLQPVIARNTIRRGKSRLIKLGDKEINFSAGFRLFMQTKLANPHYPPEIHAECTIINFTVTESGLEDQLLFLVVKLERPDLARLKSTLVAQQNEFKVKLAELEALLLEKLAASEGDILEDVDLILTLEDAKKTSDEVKEKFAIAQDTEAKINEISENYRPTASKGALFFFLLMDLRKIHSFYKYSLDAFVGVVTRAINSVLLRKAKEEPVAAAAAGGGGDDDDDEDGLDLEDEPAAPAGGGEEEEDEGVIELSGKELVERVHLLSGIVTSFAFNYTRRGLLDVDKLTVATMLALRIGVLTKSISREEVDILIRAPPDPNAKPIPESARSWLTDGIWGQLQMLESLAVFKSQNGALTQNMEQDSLGWRRWYGEARAEAADLPRSFRDISPFYRLLLLRVLRPDRLSAALTQYVHDNLGNDFVEQEPFSMDSTYEESNCYSPFFFVLFPGTDPTPTIEALGRRLGVTEANGKLVNISMGQGQENVAINALNKSAKEGGWVMLQNIHLMQNWLKHLERQLEIVEEFASPDFRCFLTSEPPSALYGPLQELCPESILQKCIKIADEAPSDVKSNLRRAWSKFSQDTIDACMKPREFKACLFSLCFFHALISGRIKFGAQGWSRKYPFNDGDLTISATVHKNYMNAAHKQENEVPWPDLRYITGEIMYGGHITDQWDRRVNNTYLAVLVIPDLLSGMNLAPGFKSPDPSKMDYQAYIKYIEEKFPPESPSLYGMHANAEIGYLTDTGIKIFRTIMNTAGGSGGGGGGDLGAVQPLITAFLETCPIPVDMMEVRTKCPPEMRADPYVIVSFQESDRMNILLGEIKRSLLELELGIAGALNVTEKMEALASCLNMNKVYAGWEKLAYPSLKSLGVWMPDLVLRVDQLKAWTDNVKLLRSTWLPALFNPNSFLTAIKQVTARSKGLPLDFMTNRSFVTNWHEVGDLPVEPIYGGTFLHGLFMEGASWEEGKGGDEGYITDSKMKELRAVMPVINCYALLSTEMTWDSMYHCPVFITSTRGATFVYQANMRMDADDNEFRWVLAGAAMLLTEE